MSKNREERITEFLKYIAAIIERYPNYLNEEEVIKNIIYSSLEDFEVPINDKQKNVQEMFPKWIEHFQKDPNTNAFIDPKWTYFCQFTNEKYNGEINSKCDPVKLYIPLDSNHLERGVKEIFEFCSKENISHHSKVAKRIRTDNLVLRVPTLEDANRIIDFINKNPYFEDNKLVANPFVYETGMMGVAVDGNYSYNIQTSVLIKDYIIKKYHMKSLESVSVEDFHNFVSTLPQDKNQNIQEINELINLATNGKNEIKDYVRHFKKVNKKFENRNLANFESLEYGIYTTICNHGINQAIEALHLYITTGNANGFSRFNKDSVNINWRKVIAQISPQEIVNYLNLKIPNTSLKSQIKIYVNECCFQKHYINEGEIQKSKGKRIKY